MSPSRQIADPLVWLIALLLLVNVLAVSTMVRTRDAARVALDEGLALETQADARAFEAALARQYAQIEEYARTQNARIQNGADDDPSRLSVLFETQAAITRARVRGRDGSVQAQMLRTSTGLVAIAPADPTPLDTSLLRASREFGDETLEVWADPRLLLDEIDPALLLHRSLPANPAGLLEPVAGPSWTPAFNAWIERRENTARVIDVVEDLARRFRWTLLFNIALLPVLLLLGALTLRRVRRIARLESERKQQERMRELEKQVQHTERLASLGRFAAGTAHEINNPLEGMANYLSLLREDLAAGRTNDAATWVDRLGLGIEQVAGTVRRVLDFAASGSRTAVHEPIVPAELFERTLALLRAHPDCRRAKIRLDVSSDFVIDGNPVTLGQLIFNLVLNACQAQDGAGEVEATAHPIVLEDEELMELRVLDRGPGFAPEALEHLFEPFQSTRGSSGLGLAVCHGIVREHRGTIEVLARDPGPGSEVRVLMPLQLAVRELSEA